MRLPIFTIYSLRRKLTSARADTSRITQFSYVVGRDSSPVDVDRAELAFIFNLFVA